MILSDISIRRPVFAAVLNLLIVILGLVAFTKLPLREFPDVDAPVVSIETLYIGASADIIETRITQPIEDIISGIEGIKTIDSKSDDGISTVTIEFTLDREIDDAANDVRDRVARVIQTLPEEADAPTISKFDANTEAIFWIALQSDTLDGMELTDYADRFIIDRLSVTPGVARVQIGGERRYAMRVWLDRKAMAARNVTVQDVQSALSRENIELPAGRIESLNRELTVRVDRVYNNVPDFENLVIQRGDDGYLVRLSDIAQVEKGSEDERTELKYNGRAAIGLGIAKQSNANALDVIRGTKEEMAKIRESLPPEIIMEVAFDSALFIEAAIHEVYFTIGLTLLLVVLVIWLFLGDLRATIIPALAIPVSLLGSFVVLMALGFSINLLTLLALVLAIGLVVDDAIVVLENIYKRIEEGQPPLAAAFKGTNQVAFAVIATTLVLVAVFLPVSLMPGDAGRLFTEFAWAIIGSILFSAFCALSLSPMLSSKILRKHEEGDFRNPVTVRINRFLDRMEGPYRKKLDFLIHKPLITIVFLIVLMVVGIFLFRSIPHEFAPTEDRGYIFSIMMAPEGSSLEYTKRNLAEMEKQMLTLLPKSDKNPEGTGEALGIVSIVPMSFSSTGAVNGGLAFILLKPWNERARHAQQIVFSLFPKYMSIPGILAFPILPQSLGGDGGSNSPVQFVIAGSNYAELAKWRDLIMERARKNTSLINLDYDYKETKPQMRLMIDQNRAADLGVSVQQIGDTLQTLFGSRKITTYLDAGEEYDVILQGQDADRLRPTDMSNVYVKSERTGELIPISNLVTFKETADAGSLNRYNRLRSITISAGLGPGYSLGDALKFFEDTAKEVLPPDAKIDYKGQSLDLKESGAGAYLTFFLALIAVYLFLAAQFENWVHPMVIMTTVPLAIVGALWGLFMANGLSMMAMAMNMYIPSANINIYTQIGLIMLAGLATKNGILIVEFANQLRDEGVEFYEAIKQSSLQRLRPILMTSFATASGALPLIFLSGAGAESRFPIGVVVFSGVIFSTFFTLFVIPTFYALMAKNTKSPETVSRQLDAELEADHEVR